MERDVKYWYLRNHHLFSQLSSDDVKTLCVISNFRKARKNEDIYFAQDGEKRIYFLKKGTLKILSLDADGNEVTKDVLMQGDIFGEITLDEAGSRAENEFARAASPEVAVCSFTLSNFEQVLQKHPTLAIRYTKQVGWRLKTLENRFSDLVFKDVRTRLVEFLKSYAAQNGNQTGSSLSTQHFLTQQDIAHIIGASRQTVATLMNELTEQNLLQYNRQSFTIPDYKAFV